MAVNATEVLYLTSGLFKAAPSKAILTDLVKFNGTIDGLAASLGTSPYAVNAFPFSNAEKAKVLAENLLGSTVADKAAAITALEGILNANGGNVGIAAAAGIRAILSDAAFADAKAQLENRVKVAAAYVDSNKGNEISTSVLDAVTKDAATVTAAIASLSGTTGGNEAGADRVLTNAQDILTGTAGNDNFRAVAGANTGNQDQTTLNSSDIIDGAAGNDTLIVNLVNGGAAANYGGGARIKNIETLKLGTNNNATFDYNVNQGQNEITDVTTIVADQINTGETLTIRNLVRDAADKALPTLSWINDSTAVNGLAGTVNAAYRAAAVSGTDDEQAINLTNVRAGTLNINAGIEKAVVASTGSSTNSIATIDSITGTNTTLKEVVINAEATAALGEGRIISTAAGTRGLEVARTPANDNTQHVSFVNVGSAVTKVDASGSKGNVNVAFTDTATAVANTFIGGEGNDQVVVNGGNDNLSGGKGNDTFIFGQTNTSANGTFFNNSDTIDGGEGTDTIQFDYGNGAVTIQTSEWLNSKGVDAIDLRGQNNRVQLDDAFVGRADATSFEVITNKIVQNDAANSVADEVNSRHQIDLSTVGANRAVKVTGGEGRETVIVTDALNGMQTLSGGNGLDVLVVKNGATLTGQDLQNVSGFNVMNLVKTSANAQVFNIDLSASFLTKAIDANAAAGTSVNTANLFRIVTDGADASGNANSLSGVQDIGAGDTINLTIDTAGLTAGSGAINVNDLLATAAAVNIRNASGQALVTKAAGVGGAITVAATAGNIFTAANATATADAAYTTTGAASVGSLTTSGQASTGGGGAAPAAGNTFTLTAAGAVVATGAAATNATLVTGTNTGTTANKDIINGLSFSTATIADSTTGDADEYNVNVIGAIAPTAVSGIENINLTLNAGGNFAATNVVTAANQFINVVTGTGIVSALTAAHNVNINAGAAGTVTLQSAAANASGNADFTVSVGGTTTQTLSFVDNTAGAATALAGAGEVVTITAASAASLSGVTMGAAALALAGAGNLNLGTVTGAVTQTSTATGNTTATYATVAANVTTNTGADALTFTAAGAQQVTTGTGADVLTVGTAGGAATVLTVNDWANGTDTMSIFAGARANITMSTAGTFAPTGITNNGILGITGTTGNDVISGTAGRDIVTGGIGADSITLGGGSDSLVYAAGDAAYGTVTLAAGAVTRAAVTNWTIAQNDTVVGAEVVTGFSTTDASGASITLGNADIAAIVAGTAGTIIDDTACIVQGTYNAATQTFTVGAGLNTGADSLLVWDADSTAGINIQTVVLVGFNSTAEGFLATAAGVLTM